MIRKTLSLILALTLSASVLIGCDQGDNYNEGTNDTSRSSGSTSIGVTTTPDEKADTYYIPSKVLIKKSYDPGTNHETIENTITYKWGENDIETYEKTVIVRRMEFDRNGNRTKQVEYNSNGSVRNRYEYEYDSNGNRTKEASYNSDGDVSWHIEWLYDTNGKLTKQVRYNYYGNVDWHIEYEYDGNGKLAKEEFFYTSNDGGSSYIEYQYDTNGKLTKQVHYDSNGNVSAEYEYEYNTNGSRTKYVNYDSDGSFDCYYEYEYDNNGRLTKFVCCYPDGIDWYRYKYEYEYDNNGNRTKMVAYKPDGSVEQSEYEWIQATEAQYKIWQSMDSNPIL